MTKHLSRVVALLGGCLLATTAAAEVSNSQWRDGARRSAAVVIATVKETSVMVARPESQDPNYTFTPSGDGTTLVSAAVSNTDVLGCVVRFAVTSVVKSDGQIAPAVIIDVYFDGQYRMVDNWPTMGFAVGQTWLLFLDRPIHPVVPAHNIDELLGSALYHDDGTVEPFVPKSAYDLTVLDGAGPAALQVTSDSQARIDSVLLQARARADRISPTVTVIEPSAAAWLRDQVTVKAHATDDTAVASVGLVVDGVPSGNPTANASDTTTFDVAFPLSTKTLVDGQHTLTALARDAADNTAQSEVQVTVDNTAPTLTVSMNPSQLWPPNKKMVSVTANLAAKDNLDPAPTVTLASITCNDGCNPSTDIVGAVPGSSATQFQLRSDRSGSGSGRTYTITYSATDKAGNVTTTKATVIVPHDQGKN